MIDADSHSHPRSYRGSKMTNDLISREAAIAAIQRLLEKEAFGSAFRVPFLDAIGALKELPIAEIGLPYVKFDDDLLATLRNCKGAVITIQEKP